MAQGSMYEHILGRKRKVTITRLKLLKDVYILPLKRSVQCKWHESFPQIIKTKKKTKKSAIQHMRNVILQC